MRAILSIAALLVVLAVVAFTARRALAPAPRTAPAAAAASAPMTNPADARQAIDRAQRELDEATKAAADRAASAD